MLKRIITSLIGFPIMAAFVVVGGVPLQFGLFVLAVIGMNEVFNATLKGKQMVRCISYFFAATYFFMIGNVGSVFSAIYLMTIQKHFSTFMLMFTSLFIIAVLILMVVLHEKINIYDCAIATFVLFYVAFLMSFIYLVRQYSYGEYFVWLIFISAWGCDTFAYFTGVTIGKHKLTPKLSPKKTIEGSIGGVVGAALIAAIYGLVVSKFFSVEDISIIAFCTITAAVGAIFSQFGDLAASAIKRSTGIKDYGKLIPGHGGVIDRFDSILFTAPIVYIVMFVLLNFA